MVTGNKTPERKLAGIRKWRAAKRRDPEWRKQQSDYQRDYRARNRDRIRKKQAAYNKANALAIRLKRKGLNPEDHAEYIQKHDGRCDICGGDPDGRWKRLNIDHCHETGKFRGLLCQKCNRGLGLFSDDERLLAKAASYVKGSKK